MRKFLNKSLKEHSVPHDKIDDWLLGESLTPPVKTVCVKESCLKKPPYHVYYRYKVVPNQTPATSSNKKAKNDTNKKANNEPKITTLPHSS